MARHVFAIGLSGPMSSSERKSERERVDCRVALSKSIPQEMEKGGSRKQEGASEQARAERMGIERAGRRNSD